MKARILAALLMVLFAAGSWQPAYAESVRIQPLQYQTELKKGEKKKGFVDITNPTAEATDLKLYVQAFSQVDNKGNLTFFDNEQVRQGVLLDYDTVALGPRQTLRLFFLVDGTKLPTGDVFAAIFAETQPKKQVGTVTSARVGTLMMIVNQTPGPRKAEITGITMPFVQLGRTVDGTIAVKNSAAKGMATGFFPSVAVEIAPWGGTTTYKGPLVFAGNTRTVDFAIPSNLFGLYQIKVSANTAEKTSWVFLITGWWRIFAPLLVAVVVALVAVGWRYRPHKRIRLHKR